MRLVINVGIRLFCFALVLAQTTGVVLAQDNNTSETETINKRARFLRDFLQDQVIKMRKTNTLSASKLKTKLDEKFPTDPNREYGQDTWQVRTEIALKAAMLVENLDKRAYKEPLPGKTLYKDPEDVTTSNKVYNIDLFNALLNKPRLEPARDHNGKTALMYAAEANRFEVLRTLLLYSGKEPFEPLYKDVDNKKRGYINWCDNYGYTALMRASAANSVEAVEAVNYLLNADAAIDTKCGVAQFTALHLAQNARHANVVSAIERKLNDKPLWRQVIESGDFVTYLVMSFVLGGATVPIFIAFVWKVTVTFKQKRAEHQARNQLPLWKRSG